MYAPSNATEHGSQSEAYVPRSSPSDARTLLIFDVPFVNQMFSPSNAMPSGPPGTSGPPSLNAYQRFSATWSGFGVAGPGGPGKPCGPCGPVDPCAPGGPTGPCGPN